MSILGIVTNCFRTQLDAGAPLVDLIGEASRRGFRAIELRQTCLGEFEAGDENLEYFAESAATESPSGDFARILARWSDALSFSGHEAEPPRGTMTVPYQREVIFSQQVEVEIEKLPRWRPLVAIDRRILEASDE